MKEDFKLSVIIPVYNERDSINEIIRRVKAVKIPKEIIIVDDFSTDGTRKILEKVRDKNIKILFHRMNLGKGAAVKTALNNSNGQIVIVQDADLEYDPEEYPRLIEPIVTGKARVVYGSRILNKNNKFVRLSFFIGGKLVTLFTNILFLSKLTDEPTCYKTFRTDVIKSIKIKSNRFDWEPEVTAKLLKRGIKIHEVPISYYPRTSKEGKKLKWRDGFIAIWILLKYRFVD